MFNQQSAVRNRFGCLANGACEIAVLMGTAMMTPQI